MKKKSMMLGGLLAAVVVTAYSVSGTYAKYISSVDLTDEARVAKWGFAAKDENGNLITDNKIDLFAKSYTVDGNEGSLKYVETSNTDKVVAPGTKGEYSFSLEGEVETRYALKFEIDETKNTDIVVYYSLKDGAVDKTSLSTTKFDGALEYRPIRYTVKYTRGTDATDLTNGNLTNLDSKTLINFLKEDNKNVRPYKAGNFDQKYTISWEWLTNNTTNNATDKAVLTTDDTNILDTFAGQEIAKALSGAEGADTNFGKLTFDVKVTAEQVTAEDADGNAVSSKGVKANN